MNTPEQYSHHRDHCTVYHTVRTRRRRFQTIMQRNVACMHGPSAVSDYHDAAAMVAEVPCNPTPRHVVDNLHHYVASIRKSTAVQHRSRSPCLIRIAGQIIYHLIFRSSIGACRQAHIILKIRMGRLCIETPMLSTIRTGPFTIFLYIGSTSIFKCPLLHHQGIAKVLV